MEFARFRLLDPAVSRASLIPVVIATMALSYMGFSEIQGPISRALTCYDDLQKMIQFVESTGQTTYQGICVAGGQAVETGNSPSSASVVENLRTFEVPRAQEGLDAVVSLLDGPGLPKSLARTMGGYPGVLMAFFLGGLVFGSQLESGLAGWLISNGWTRRRLWWTQAARLALGVVIGYFALVLTTGAILIGWAAFHGLERSTSTASIVALLAPIPALMFYGFAGSIAAIAFRRGAAVGLLLFAVMFAELVWSSRFTPLALHLSLLLNLDFPKLTPELFGAWPGPLAWFNGDVKLVRPDIAALMMGSIALSALAISYAAFTRIRIPDRPR